MSKIINALNKLKNTKIEFKKPDLASIKHKFDTESSKSTLNNLKNMDVTEFYNRYRQQILTYFVSIMGVFFLFYWTHTFISSKIDNAEYESTSAYSKLEKVVNMAANIRNAENTGVKGMNQGLLSFVQDTSNKLNISNKMVNLRPINASKGIEHVTLRLENLYYDEFIKFIAEVETYDNLNIKSLNFNRRYDNPNMIDSTIEIVKM